MRDGEFNLDTTDVAPIARALGGERQLPSGWSARCPAHDDHTASLTLGVGDDGKLLVHCHAGCAQATVVDAIKKRGLWPEREPTPKTKSRRRYVAFYNYTDDAGSVVLQVVRTDPKGFYQRHPDGLGGWVNNAKDLTQVPFRLPDLIQAIANGKRVYVTEGEKDVLNLSNIGVTATCNAGGAGKWKAEFARHFVGANVVVIPDNDDTGRAHAEHVARSLSTTANVVRILNLPDLPPKGDVSDWLAAGGTAIDLDTLAEAAPSWKSNLSGAASNSDDLPTGFTDDALALEFTRRHGAGFRFVAGWGKWLKWTGTRWTDETTLEVLDLSRGICREASARAESPKVAAIVAKATTVAAVERLARADRQHAATIEIWDADPWLLNTPTGVVDLRSGKMRRHRADDHMTKTTAVGPGGNCPTWLAFLDRIMASDSDLIAFLQRVAGYALTGSTRDHALFFGYGTGGNGKGVFLGATVGILGSYATVAPMETFTASAGDRHPTDLAMLRGARLVTAQETEEGRQWAESKIKSLTGGDPITARFMRQDFFTFAPQFKLLIAGNHKPGLRNVDEAMRRRFHLIPFTQTIPANERDPELPEKLKAEWPGILKWMIDGCLAWQKVGLAPPKAVIDATTDYLETEDCFSVWLGECCVRRPGDFETAADLYSKWKDWAERSGEAPGSQKRFSEQMQSRGFASSRRHGGVRGFSDIGLIRPNYSEDARYGN